MAKSLLVVSTYPPQGSLHGNKFSAVARYTKSTLLSMGKNFSFEVLADKLPGEKDQYQEENVKVWRCWERGSQFLLFEIFRKILAFGRREILFCFEWGMFGRNLLNLVFLPLFLIILRLTGRKIYFVSHGVLLDYNQVAPQLGDQSKSWKIKFGTFGLRTLYFFILLCSQKVVVFEEYLREELLGLFNCSNKIVTIPHGVDRSGEIFSKNEAKKKLGLKENQIILISFGFLVWYKGSDWLIQTLARFFEKHPNSKLKLLMVGGESQIHKKDPIYINYLNQLYKFEKQFPEKIKITGFVPEDKIGLYFSAADLVILPYRVLVSASGPLSFVFSYKKAFLLSDRLKGYVFGEDFRESLAKFGLKFEEISFPLEEVKFVERVESVIGNQKRLEEIKNLSGDLCQKRSWPIIGKRYQKLFKD